MFISWSHSFWKLLCEPVISSLRKQVGPKNPGPSASSLAFPAHNLAHTKAVVLVALLG